MMSEFFRVFSHKVSNAMGKPSAFVTAILLIVAWASVGSIFNYSDTWQLVINTSTTIITFLMVFLIQNTQNRDARVTGLKLDEILRAQKGARNHVIQLEDLADTDLDALEAEFQILQQQHTHLHQTLSAMDTVIKAHKKSKKKHA